MIRSFRSKALRRLVEQGDASKLSVPNVRRVETILARLLGTSRQTLYDILNEKQPVTPAMALRFARMFGGSAESWVNMQRNYDLKIAERELGDALDKIPRLEAA